MSTWWSRCHSRWTVLCRRRNLAEWWLLVRVLTFAALVPLFMQLKLPRLTRLLAWRCERPPAAGPTAETSARIIRAVEDAVVLGAPLISPRCLTRGLTRYYFLRRAGVELSLSFGAGFGPAGFSGHCWLMQGGEPFLEPTDPRPRFVTMYSVPEGAPAPARTVPA